MDDHDDSGPKPPKVVMLNPEEIRFPDDAERSVGLRIGQHRGCAHRMGAEAGASAGASTGMTT
jgi:hypothetical protein